MRTVAFSVIVFFGCAGAAVAGDPMKGKQVFAKCSPCHAVGPGATKRMGPELNGVVGRKWASLPDYNYSQDLLAGGKQGKVWDAATLNDYLQNPKRLAPHGKMPFAGLKDEEQRKDIIAYLAQFDEQGQKKVVGKP